MKSLLILGDHYNLDTNQNIKRLQRYSSRDGLNPRILSYSELFQGKIPNFPKATTETVVMPFFPFDFWNKECEVPEDTAVYGTSRESYSRFSHFLEEAEGKLEIALQINPSYVIDLGTAAIDRDKIETHTLLEKSGIPTTKTLPKDLQRILEASREGGIFIKARYGAMGKGITYLSPCGWLTNYRVGKNNSIENWPKDTKWNFTDITGNIEFLKRLLGLEVIIEEEVRTPPLRRDLKFDVRAYSVYQEVPHMFVRENDRSRLVTNFSQGGVINHKFRKALPESTITLIDTYAKQTAAALNSNFLGVDVIFQDNLETPKILEVQTFTGFPKIRQFNLTKHLSERIKLG